MFFVDNDGFYKEEQ